jgi:hypothetical protein
MTLHYYSLQHILKMASQEANVWAAGIKYKDVTPAQRKHIHDRVSHNYSTGIVCEYRLVVFHYYTVLLCAEFCKLQ